MLFVQSKVLSVAQGGWEPTFVLDYGTSLKIAKDLIWVSPNYVSSTMDCAKKSGWSSIWTIFALAEVIGIPVESVVKHTTAVCSN
jgi:hypothetical protein